MSKCNQTLNGTHLGDVVQLEKISLSISAIV